ncbi:MAG: carboxylesterase family protein [Beduini sp.]|uniref:carboxylesterase family protein n=1 Tax=Beduini sp. TaxID=1922300 RepID=UPI0011CCC523
MIIETTLGKIEGYKENNLYLFKGIPYAVAERFQAPQSISWKGILDCTHYRDKAAQIVEGDITIECSENGLNLNVYTPSLNEALPVLVEIHGGAFQNGSNQKMDPYHVIGNRRLVYVTINYRLGVFGYLYLGKELKEEFQSSGNNGTLDQIAALKWVHNHIHQFGGDPNKVTVLGSSAGAKSLGAIMMHSEAKHYFQQVILVSGAAQSVRDINTAQKITKRYKEIMKIEDLNDLLTMSVSELLKGQQVLCKGFGSTCIFGPVADDVVIPSSFFKKLDSKDYWQGKAIIGSSKHELVFFKLMGIDFHLYGEQIARELFGQNASIAIEDAKILMKEYGEEEAWIKVLSDYMYRTYSYRLGRILTENGSTVWQYSTEFLPACHCMDHILSFEPREKLNKYFPDIPDKKEIIRLGDMIKDAYLSFVEEGKPNIESWKPLNESNCQMIWDDPIHIEKLEDEVCDRFPDQVYIL